MIGKDNAVRLGTAQVTSPGLMCGRVGLSWSVVVHIKHRRKIGNPAICAPKEA